MARGKPYNVGTLFLSRRSRALFVVSWTLIAMISLFLVFSSWTMWEIRKEVTSQKGHIDAVLRQCEMVASQAETNMQRIIAATEIIESFEKRRLDSTTLELPSGANRIDVEKGMAIDELERRKIHGPLQDEIDGIWSEKTIESYPVREQAIP